MAPVALARARELRTVLGDAGVDSTTSAGVVGGWVGAGVVDSVVLTAVFRLTTLGGSVIDVIFLLQGLALIIADLALKFRERHQSCFV